MSDATSKQSKFCPLIDTSMTAYQGVKNVSFLENFTYVLNEWPLVKRLISNINDRSPDASSKSIFIYWFVENSCLKKKKKRMIITDSVTNSERSTLATNCVWNYPMWEELKYLNYFEIGVLQSRVPQISRQENVISIEISNIKHC